MATRITSGISVTVETFYQEKHSHPEDNVFVHAYKITILNERSEAVQLMRRHWYIRDSNNVLREVEGDGVIGIQPLILPGEAHEYVSWTNLASDIGKMYGYYTMLIDGTNEYFDVRIPDFTLMAPMRLN